jgi:hypothetical protein
MSSELPNVMSTEFFGEHAFIIAHVNINMNLSRRHQMSNNLKKIKIIKMMALKQKVKLHFMNEVITF